jgi:hypothetical protein
MINLAAPGGKSDVSHLWTPSRRAKKKALVTLSVNKFNTSPDPFFFSAYVELYRTSTCFPFGEEKLVAPLVAIPNVDRANQRQEKGKKLN